jgi:hypothetical protein
LDLKLRLAGGLTVSSLKRLASALDAGGQTRIHAAMGWRFAQIAKSTFGPNGQNRPNDWRSLSPRYQKAIGYFGPPKLVLYGALIRSIDLRRVSRDSVEIEAGSDYAEEHQHGSERLPRRGFFPVNAATLTRYAEAELRKAAQSEFEKLMI